ncbi:MAG: hypothetical protein AAF226_01145 [Verrucomicrobiota bacterium]
MRTCEEKSVTLFVASLIFLFLGAAMLVGSALNLRVSRLDSVKTKLDLVLDDNGEIKEVTTLLKLNNDEIKHGETLRVYGGIIDFIEYENGVQIREGYRTVFRSETIHRIEPEAGVKPITTRPKNEVKR